MLKIIISAFALTIIMMCTHMLFVYAQEQKLLEFNEKSVESDIPIVKSTTIGTKPWSTYENIKYGIKIKHPRNWDVDTQNSIDRYGCQIDIVKLTHPIKPVELNIFITLYDKETRPDSLYDELEFREIDYAFFDIISSSASSHMGNYPAYEITYDEKVKMKTLRTWEFGTIRGDNVYNIDFRAYIKDFKLYKTVAERMISTFEIVHPLTIKSTGFSIDESSPYMQDTTDKRMFINLPYMLDTSHKLMHVNCIGPDAPT
jgi:hypothetical protein